ncbi:MAG: biotin--[acetyl-CoA-carboxylase] ligase [Caulobacter sp.]|nr:biotin--[acetyl-CoA-carboxylase] ligase [Caulobacter sp.]
MTAPRIEALDEIDSTNADARRRAEAGEVGPLWITATRQTAGRGRRGRNWETGQGNLAATLLFVTDRPPAEAAQISFVAALAVADLADAFVPASQVTLKWPNDPMIDGRKTSGILVESGQHAGGLWVAVGIGVNLSTPPEVSERPATAFAEHMTAPPPRPLEALAVLSEAFERWRRLWQTAGFPPVAEAWTRRAHGLGEACTARLGHETVAGIAEGLDPDGALRLRLPDGMLRRITAGDVFFGEA